MNFARRTNWELHPNRFAEALSVHRATRKELLDLTASNPPEAELEYDADAILAAFRNPKSLEYHPEPKGLLSAREAVASYCSAGVPPAVAGDIWRPQLKSSRCP